MPPFFDPPSFSSTLSFHHLQFDVIAWVRWVYLIAKYYFTILSHAMLYIQHSKIALYKFIPSFSWSPPCLLKSPYTLPNSLCPFFQHVQTTSVYPWVCSFFCDLSTCQRTFYPPVSHYTFTVPSSCHFSPALPSPLLSVPRSPYHREQHSCLMPGKLLPFVCSENTFGGK